MAYKKPEQNTDQERLLNIQLSMAKKTKITDIITALLLIVFIFSFAIGIIVKTDDTYSEQENRYLQTAPKIQSDFDGNIFERIANGKFLDRFFSGDFTSELADYYADQFPLRNIFVGIKGVAEIAQLKGMNNDVVLGKNGYLIKREDYPDKEKLKSNAEAITAFSDALEERDIPYIVAFAGRPVDELTPYLPSLYPTIHSEETWEYFTSLFASDDYMTFLNLRDVLSEKISENVGSDEDSDLILYKTDHHWTSFGAYYGYAEIVKALGDTPYSIDDFTPELVSDEFYGTTWSSAGMKWISADKMYYLRYDGDDTEYTTTIVDTGEAFAGFYDRSYLEKKDKYSSFIGGNNALVTVEKTSGNTEGRKRLLLVKDSYAHSLAPILARNYDLVIVDLRYYKDSTIALAEEYSCDAVVVISYLGSITNANVFQMLRYGI